MFNFKMFNVNKNKKLLKYKSDLEDMKKIVELNKKNRMPNIYDYDDNGHLHIHMNFIKLGEMIDDCLELIEYYQKPIMVEGKLVEIDGEFKIDCSLNKYMNQRYYDLSNNQLIEYITFERCSEMEKWLTAYVEIKNDWSKTLPTTYYYKGSGIDRKLQVGDRVRLRAYHRRISLDT